MRAARVSRGTFYALFASKEACFLEAYRHGVDVLVARIDAAVRADAGDWRGKLRAACAPTWATLDAEPRFARAYLFEIHVAGPRAGAARDAAIRRFAEPLPRDLRAARRRPRARARPTTRSSSSSAGVDQLVCAHVRGGRAR